MKYQISHRDLPTIIHVNLNIHAKFYTVNAVTSLTDRRILVQRPSKVAGTESCLCVFVSPFSAPSDSSMDDHESNLSRQIQTVERSVLFLRQEHLSMLHGLHLEILSLQKRCTELTSDLNLKPPGRSQIEEILDARCCDLKNRLTEKECALAELRKELSTKGSLVGALRANLKEKERHFLEELKHRSHCSTVLNRELQKQTEAAAYLSFQLHAQRVQRARECVPMEKVLGPAEPTAMPDPALFLHPHRHRARSRLTLAQRRDEDEEKGGGERPHDEAGRLVSSAAASSAAQTNAD
uniref:Coiled-coil domain containing 92B n=1 Tax=Oryzias sinensis TaxID=183150 RepID=A0A8C8DTG0_9TELE